MYHYEYLNDAEFLKEFTNEKIIEQYVKILILDWDQQHVIKEISGKTIGGSINVDATSAMRRTATVQMLVDENSNKLTNLNNLISINKKVDLQIGFKNFTNKYSQYPILWFPQGRFLIINANISYGKDNYTINLTLHDKMALLNGECGGVLPAPITFSEMEEEDAYGNTEITNPKISSIIRELMVHWGNQSEKNIIINDIEPYSRQVLRWAPQDKDEKLFYFNISPENPMCKDIPQLTQVSNNISNNESQFYEKLLIDLIKIGMKKNKNLKVNQQLYFPQSSLIVKYLLEKTSSDQIDELKKVVQNLKQILKNSKSLFENYEKEASSLTVLKKDIESQITTSPEEIIKALNDLYTYTTNIYNNKWKKYYQRTELLYGKNDEKESRKLISKNLSNLNKLKPIYQKKEEINNIISQVSTLKNKIVHAKNQMGKTVSFSYESTTGETSTKVVITPRIVLSWIFANTKTTDISTMKKVKTSILERKKWLNNKDQTFSFKDSQNDKKTFFIRTASSKDNKNGTGYTKIGYYNDYANNSFFDFYISLRGNDIFLANALFLDEKQSDKWDAILNYKCIDQLSKIILKFSDKYTLHIKRQFSSLMRGSLVTLITELNKSQINKELETAIATNICNAFVNFCEYCLSELTLIKNDYDYNIATLKYIRNYNKQKQTKDIQNYIDNLVDLVNKLPRQLNKSFPLPNPKTSIEYQTTNLRDMGKYMVDNSGIFSDSSKQQKTKIKNDNVEYIKYLYNNLNNIINNIDFEELSFSEILILIETTIITNTANFIKDPSKKGAATYISFFEKHYKQQQPQSLRNIRLTLSMLLTTVNNRLDKIKEEQLTIPNACNQIYKKWFKKSLPSYLELQEALSKKNEKERQLNEYKQNKKNIEANLKQIENLQKNYVNQARALKNSGSLARIQLVNQNLNSARTANEIKQASLEISGQLAVIEDFANISNLNFYENQIRLLEEDIEQQEKRLNKDATSIVSNVLKEIEQSLTKKQELLEKLIKDWEKEKLKFINNFIQNNKENKSQQQFYVAFAKAALERDQNSIHYWKSKINKKIDDMLPQDRQLIYTDYFGGSIPAKNQKQIELINSNFNKFWENIYYGLIIPIFKKSDGIKIFNYGDDVGYTLTESIFPGELICQPGDTITSVLDKIKNTLGNYEYFYDINGQFVFQEIKNYLNTSYSTFLSKSQNTNKLFANYYNTLQFAKYDFSNENIIQSYQNNPQYELIKNDFLIWGERKTIDGQKIPIRYHLAIDAQPMTHLYYFFDVPPKTLKIYHYKKDLPLSPEQSDLKKVFYVKQENKFYNWVNQDGYYGYEQINILADNLKCSHFISKNNFPKQGSAQHYYYDETAKILYIYKNEKYERTHTYSIKACVREYNPSFPGVIGQYYYLKEEKDTISHRNHIYLCTGEFLYEDVTDKVGTLLTINCIGTALYLEGLEAEKNGLKYNDYYTQLKNEWPKIWDLWNNKMYNEVENNLSGIDYFLNILTSSSLVNQFGISKIGKRTKVISNNAINCIFEPICPEIMFFDSNPPIEQNQPATLIKTKQNDYLKLLKNKTNYLNEYNYNHLSNYQMINIEHSIYKDMKIGGILRSAYEEIRSELYQYINYCEQISLSSLPIYYLEANDIIKLLNLETNINGNYIVKSFSLPLNVDGSMNITCSKIISRI